jgi:hypothetical protein
MVKPNYAFERRQRDLAKKAKNEEKRARKRNQTQKPAQESESTTTQNPTV